MSATELDPTQIWTPGNVGNWFTGANWKSGTVPQTGDTAVIQSGTAIISSLPNPSIVGEDIQLGGLTVGSPVTLVAIDATFEGSGSGASEVNTTLTVTGGKPTGSTVDAIFLVEGNTSFDGQIFIEPIGGSFTIDSESDGTHPGTFTFLNTDLKATMLVSQESFLAFKGGTFVNYGLIQIEGGADIATGVTFTGKRTDPGTFTLENGGQLSVEGSVDASQQIDFFDGTGKLTINNLSGFSGVIGFAERPASGGESTGVAGGRIDLSGVQAQSAQFVQGSEKTGTLYLYAGPHQTGAVVAQLTMQMVSVKLKPTESTLKSADFQIASDGEGGTLVTYAPQGPTYLEASLPAPVIAQTGSMVALSTILKQSFGTETPWRNINDALTLVPPDNLENTKTDQKYWATEVKPGWYVNGALITQNYVVQSGDQVELKVGNNISNPAQIQVQVTKDGTGTSAEFVTYSVWTVDPAVAQAVQNSGAIPGSPTPANIVASADSLATTFPGVPNTNLCNWISDDVAAAADAPMPLPNASLDPTLNVSGGFWRIVYTGTGPSPVQDWSTLVQPGDIVRMGWFKPEQPQTGRISGHSTTVLSTVNADGQISFYDNVDFINNVSYIGIHDDNYWLRTNPQDITIYRLDPNQQYLIQGTSLSEVIQGSIYNNLIEPAGGADIITAGAGNNEIQGTTTQLNSVTVTDFHLNDILDFTDLKPSQATVSYSAGALHVLSDSVQVATVTLPNPPSGYFFAVTPDAHGGSNVGLVPEVVTIQNDHLGITRLPLSSEQATSTVNSIIAGTQTEAQYVNGLLAQVQNTALPAVAVEGSMYSAAGTSAEVTLLTTQVLPPQVALATQNGLNPQVYASETLGLTFAFGNETGSTSFAVAFGPSNPAMPNSTAGDTAFAAAAATAIFASASTPNITNAVETWVANWKAFYTSNGIPGIASPSSDQIDLAARGTTWGDTVGTALNNHLGPLIGQVTNFLENAAQGTAIYSTSLVNQPTHAPFQGSSYSPPVASNADSDVQLLGVAPNLDHATI